MPRQHLSKEQWAELRTAYASGIGLRELARNAGIPAGTVLAHAKREGWTAQIRDARMLATRPHQPHQSPAVTPMQAAALSMHERGQRHVERMAGLAERATEHMEALDGSTILERIHHVEKLDTVARRTFGLNDTESPSIGMVNVALIQAVFPKIEPSKIIEG
jgi:hypothetical protein